MDPSDVKPENIHIAVALLLKGQEDTHGALKKLGQVVEEVKVQTTKTNGRVNVHDTEILSIRENQCSSPNSCGVLGRRVRKLEDERVRNQGRVEGIKLSGRVVEWAIGGGAVALLGGLAKLVGLL